MVNSLAEKSGWNQFDTLKECAQFCKDLTTWGGEGCTFFQWNTESLYCYAYNRGSRSYLTGGGYKFDIIYDLSSCVGLDQADQTGTQWSNKGKLSL